MHRCAEECGESRSRAIKAAQSRTTHTTSPSSVLFRDERDSPVCGCLGSGLEVSCRMQDPVGFITKNMWDDCVSPRRTLPIKRAHNQKPNMNDVSLLSPIHISEPTRLGMISYAVFCLK